MEAARIWVLLFSALSYRVSPSGRVCPFSFKVLADRDVVNAILLFILTGFSLFLLIPSSVFFVPVIAFFISDCCLFVFFNPHPKTCSLILERGEGRERENHGCVNGQRCQTIYEIQENTTGPLMAIGRTV